MLSTFPSLQDEKFDTQKGPSIEELVAKEGVDKLDYMGWAVDEGADPKQVRKICHHLKFSLHVMYNLQDISGLAEVVIYREVVSLEEFKPRKVSFIGSMSFVH